MRQLKRAESSERMAAWWYQDLCRSPWQRGRQPTAARWQKRERRRACRRVGKLCSAER